MSVWLPDAHLMREAPCPESLGSGGERGRWKDHYRPLLNATMMKVKLTPSCWLACVQVVTQGANIPSQDCYLTGHYNSVFKIYLLI